MVHVPVLLHLLPDGRAARKSSRILAFSVNLASGFASLGEPEKIVIFDVARFNESVRDTLKKHSAGEVVRGDFGIIFSCSDQPQ